MNDVGKSFVTLLAFHHHQTAVWERGHVVRHRRREFNEQFNEIIAYWFSRLPVRASQIKKNHLSDVQRGRTFSLVDCMVGNFSRDIELKSLQPGVTRLCFSNSFDAALFFALPFITLKINLIKMWLGKPQKARCVHESEEFLLRMVCFSLIFSFFF